MQRCRGNADQRYRVCRVRRVGDDSPTRRTRGWESSLHDCVKVRKFVMIKLDEVLVRVVVRDRVLPELAHEHIGVCANIAGQRIAVAADQHRGSLARHKGAISSTAIEHCTMTSWSLDRLSR